ncbi:SUMF1/EgtB/PvdO family nonheme iron enzyme [Celeribacter sp. PS-C1]|uniref:SUMF1/EgtB/PvdO family nonheme iron enzyme n=1 Tax=Celeribacter sp. PS-C1 TaxID=2820813 RepID=UPI001C6748CD|nr:SUMF1/EgtB/PvdO family nonheme iron enzyme [Celeribacter sp. PS-C1]MBW6419486.1 formylglycine-generating enzyme family protein [Celeribacter sp. PS-C1]
MTKSSSKCVVKYLPYKEFHIAELTDVKPDYLRGSARRLVRDREDIKHTTALNFICKELGFQGGFAGYKKGYESEVEDFMARNGLQQPGLYNPEIFDRPIRIDLQRISDRLFHSERERPLRVFTGVGVDWYDLLTEALHLPGFTVVNLFSHQALGHDFEVDLARRDPPAQWVIHNEEDSLSFHGCIELENLLGDQLLTFAGEQETREFVSQLYFPSSMTSGEILSEQKATLGAGRILSRLISKIDKGWVDIIPFNERLVFLRDQNGGYDFVFPRLRKGRFDHNVHLPFLKNADVPKSDDHYHFQRWCYFEYDGWREWDMHEAEIAFYAQGGQARNYPGKDEILRAYLLKNGRYKAPSKKAALVDGFKRVRVGDKFLAVSDLISISRFRDFMIQENDLYAEYRPKAPDQEDWQQCNQEDDIGTAPASVTWYDASAFAATMSKKRNLPVRLPTEDEWLAITEEFQSNLYTEQMADIYSADQRVVVRGETSPMHGWFGTTYKCPDPDLPWCETKDNVKFLRSIDIGEWLLPKGAAINTKHLGSMNVVPLHLEAYSATFGEDGDRSAPRWENRVSATRDRMAPDSTGAYKSWRIGFRLVYELE